MLNRVCLLVLAWGSSLQAQTPPLPAAASPSAVLRWAAQADVLSLDPHSQNHAPTGAVLIQAYEGLTRHSAGYEVEPALATSWTYLSPTLVRFHLRRDVIFHDGTPFGADDVVFSFARIRQPQGTMQVYVHGISEVRKVDDHTVDVMLAGPHPLLLRNLVDFRIMSKTWAERHGATRVADYRAREENYASRAANGTGPYRIVEWIPDNRVSMTLHPRWWEKPSSNVSDVIYRPIASDPTRVAALVSGDVDMVTDLPPQDAARLRSEPGLKVIDGPEVRTIFIALDQGSDELKYSNVKGRNPFKDKRVREALSVAIDRAAIRTNLMRGLSIPAGIMVAPGVNGHAPDFDTPPAFDPPRAKALLSEAGYPNGFQFRLNCPNNRYVNDEAICQTLAAMWARIDVTAQLSIEPMALHGTKVQNFDTSAYMFGWAVPNFDAQFTLQSLVMTKRGGADGSFNFNRISDPIVDGLVDGMKAEPDALRRNQLIRDALQRVKTEHLLLPLHHQVRPWAMRRSITTVHRMDDRPEARFTAIAR
jgi:peptide/nickel transport system substrate-binding protein